MILCPYLRQLCPILMKFGITRQMLRVYEFYENRRRKGHTFLMGVKVYSRLYPEAVRNFKSKERLGKVCVLRHRAKHFCIVVLGHIKPLQLIECETPEFGYKQRVSTRNILRPNRLSG
jgi:predicted RNA-binding protein